MALYAMLAPVVLLVLLGSIMDGRMISRNDLIKISSGYSSILDIAFPRSNEVEDDTVGTKWAVLIAGSKDYYNYRHQADVCHAYHVLKQGGLKDENIIVFMYDDIAFNEQNPRPGVIINSPKGENLYPGVPKDYTGKDVNPSNVYAVILGDKKSVTGGSGKVLDTSPNDHIFIYFAGHGFAGYLVMPAIAGMKPIWANDFVDVLKKKHDSKSYKGMVIYVEACECGSIFEGLLPTNLSIYATTASNAIEVSYATYCKGPDHPVEYTGVCLGDLYSVAWLEDSDKCDPTKEPLEQQYVAVKNRTAVGDEGKLRTSHVMQFGDLKISEEVLAVYMGSKSTKIGSTTQSNPAPSDAIEQREADLFYLQEKVKRFGLGSKERNEAQKELDEEVSNRKHVDQSVAAIGRVLFGESKGNSLQTTVRPAGQPLVDDWDCFKAMVATYEEHCGPLSNYGRKYLRTFINMCNAGSHKDQLAQAAVRVCAI